MITKAVAVAAASLVAATPALAQDDVTTATYTGPRVEVRGGIDFVSSGVVSDQTFGDRGEFGDDERGSHDALIGAEAGFDFAVGSSLVLGGYAGIEWSQSSIPSVNNRPYNFEAGRNITVGARVGVPVSRGAMVYAKGGYSNGRLKPEFLTGADRTLFNDYDSNRNGLHAGAGAEIPFMQRAYARAEYVYHHYKKYDAGATLAVPFRRHQLVAGVGFRF